MRISKGAWGGLVCLVFGVIVSIAVDAKLKNQKLRKEQQMLRHEIAVAKQNMLIRDTIRDTVEVVTQRVTTVEKVREVLSKEDRALIKDLGIKMSELQAFQKMGTANGDTVFLAAVEQHAGKDPGDEASLTQHTDSMPGGDAEGTDSVLRYRDAWMEFAYWPKTRKLVWESRDTFDIAVQREYKRRFLWWKWGTKGYWTKLVSHNKRTRITYNRFVMKE